MSDTSPTSTSSPSSPETSRHLKVPQPSTPSSSQRAPRPTIQTTRPTSSRLPPPQLFQNPPSHNASHISLALPTSSPSTNFSASSPETTRSPQSTRDQPRPSHIPPASSFSGPSISAAVDRPSRLPGLPSSRNNDKSTTSSTGATDGKQAAKHPQQQDPDDQRTDALWAEMQNTLAEVELSTTMTASHVFGEGHARALEELRGAQLGLARAWARNDAQEHDEEDTSGDTDEPTDGGGGNGGGLHGDIKEGLVIGALREGMLGVGSSPSNAVKSNGAASHNKSSNNNKKDETNGSRKNSRTLEEETERDMLLARKRREANDRYFQQVNNGVLDVVRKLEEVAGAMRRVERESREIWNEDDDDDDAGGGIDEEEGEADEEEPVGHEGDHDISHEGGMNGMGRRMGSALGTTPASGSGSASART